MLPKELPFSAVLVPVRTELVRLSARYHSLCVKLLGPTSLTHRGRV